MRRGDVILVQSSFGAATKARPIIIVQHTATLASTSKITACPLTSVLAGDEPIRPVLQPTADNGLRQMSAVEVDWIFTEHSARFGSVIGTLDPDEMRSIDNALRLWLDI